MSKPAPALGLLQEQEKWLMMPGERAALEGVLSMLKPRLSIEIGTHLGGSLASISEHSRAVHSFDLVRRPEVTSERFPNVTFHIGDSRELLTKFLGELEAAGESVDFALVDGDHSAHGARRDLEDLLASRSVEQTVILLHDTLNERVRAGLEQIDYGAFGKVRFVDLDFVQGRVMREGRLENEFWCGLGLVVTGWDLGRDSDWAQAYSAPEVYGTFAEALAQGREEDRLGYSQLVDLERELATQEQIVKMMERSLSWRITAPLRSVRQLLRRQRRFV